MDKESAHVSRDIRHTILILMMDVRELVQRGVGDLCVCTDYPLFAPKKHLCLSRRVPSGY